MTLVTSSLRTFTLGILMFAMTCSSANFALGQCGDWTIPAGAGLAGGTGTTCRAMTTWDPDGPGPRGAVLVVAGSLGYGPVVTWDSATGAWQSLGSFTQKFCVSIYKGSLYAGGTYASGTGRLVRFNIDGSTQDVSPGNAGAGVYSLMPFQDELIVAGSFYWIGTSISNIARWNGTTHLPFAGSSSAATPFALAVYQDRLIAAGNFSTVAGPAASNIAEWTGTTWVPLGTGIDGPVHALTTHDGQLFAGGTFGIAGGVNVNSIAAWDGAVWSALGANGDNGVAGTVRAITSFGDDLIVGGLFASAGGGPASNIAAWNPALGGWSALDAGFPTEVFALTTYKGDLIAGGRVHSTVVTTIGRWRSQIAQTPESRTVGLGCSTTFIAVPAVGLAEQAHGVRYQWKRNGDALQNGLGGASQGGGTVEGASGVLFSTQPIVLTLNGVEASDQGDFTLSLESNCRPMTSMPARLSVCSADFNCSGSVSVQDIFDFLAAFFAQHPRADHNRVFGISVQDLFDFLADYFVECV